MEKTTILGLYVTPSTDKTTPVRDWIDYMAASDKASNMQLIDQAIGELRQTVQEGGSQIPVGDEVDDVEDGDLLYAKRGDDGISISVKTLKEYIVGQIDAALDAILNGSGSGESLPDGDEVSY